MPKLVDPDIQRREIRDAARRVFARRGVPGTGLAHVATEAGMGRSSLYHYYRDKGTLLSDLMRDVLGEEQAVFTGVLGKSGSPLQRVERLIAALVEAFPHWTEVGRLAFDLRLRDAPSFRPLFRRLRSRLGAVITEGQRQGEMDPHLDANLAAATLIGVVDGLLLQHFVDRKAFPDLSKLRTELLVITRKVLSP